MWGGIHDAGLGNRISGFSYYRSDIWFCRYRLGGGGDREGPFRTLPGPLFLFPVYGPAKGIEQNGPSTDGGGLGSALFIRQQVAE